MPIKEDGGLSTQTKERDYNIGHTLSSSVSVFVLLGFSDFERGEVMWDFQGCLSKSLSWNYFIYFLIG